MGTTKKNKISAADEIKECTKILLQAMALVQMVHTRVKKFQKAVLKEIGAKDVRVIHQASYYSGYRDLARYALWAFMGKSPP